jgi:hypothetical protein
MGEAADEKVSIFSAVFIPHYLFQVPYQNSAVSD